MTTTKRPKVLRDIIAPDVTVYAGEILRWGSDYYLGGWGVLNANNAYIDKYPDWFAWVSVCDECDKECPSGHHVRPDRVYDVCMGHPARLPYPDVAAGLSTHVNGTHVRVDIDSATMNDASNLRNKIQTVVLDYRRMVNDEARRT